MSVELIELLEDLKLLCRSLEIQPFVDRIDSVLLELSIDCESDRIDTTNCVEEIDTGIRNGNENQN